MAEYFGDLLPRVLSRRTVLKTALFGAAGLTLATLTKGCATAPALGFPTIYPNTDDKITLPEGFEHGVVIRWGDALDGGENLNWNRIHQTVTAADVQRQQQCFGYNCDFVGYQTTPDGKHLLVVNHEYTNPELMFQTVGDRPNQWQAALQREAHGLSIVEIAKNANGGWQYVKASPYNRRITGSTPCEISGPAKGHALLKTAADPTGTRVNGTLNNCAAGKTPWGTVLTCEENFHSYFGGSDSNLTGMVKELHKRYDIPNERADRYGFYLYEDRFNIAKEPQEAFRFGWVVEVDPLSPDRAPIKRTALGRFRHEAATTVIAPDGRVVVYMGDDERFEYAYKFITKGKYQANDRAANLNLLDEGELYVARFNDDLTGEWRAIARVEGSTISPNPNLPTAFQQDPALCFIYTRAAADALGATKMDRPEDFEWNPVTKSVWLALTYNEKRKAKATDGANPRPENVMGHVIEMIEQGNNPTALQFQWRLPLLCGDPSAPEKNRQLVLYGEPTNAEVPPISAPDNLTFDRAGNVWIATDGNGGSTRLGKNDGVYVLNPQRRELKMFLSGVPGCEICGPEFSSDYQTFFCAIQHPGEGAKSTADLSTRWPYGEEVVVPRPAVIAVWRSDGREVSA
ncbi:PhoX family phosphatase [Thermosynechococcus sp. PP22]|uniref:PhoX family protein n=1 Tax=Thermosynechococcus sp. PP22 TaxID=3074082 RepID=UPI0028739BF0|nr:PhoX family phosphatase [Thermosynechococcus sp. PP22]WNC21291.1 PhoX family phosphatase [Thermosynechococcus sp. PP22]